MPCHRWSSDLSPSHHGCWQLLELRLWGLPHRSSWSDLWSWSYLVLGCRQFWRRLSTSQSGSAHECFAPPLRHNLIKHWARVHLRSAAVKSPNCSCAFINEIRASFHSRTRQVLLSIADSGFWFAAKVKCCRFQHGSTAFWILVWVLCISICKKLAANERRRMYLMSKSGCCFWKSRIPSPRERLDWNWADLCTKTTLCFPAETIALEAVEGLFARSTVVSIQSDPQQGE